MCSLNKSVTFTEKLWIHKMIYEVDSFCKWIGVFSGKICYLSIFLIVGQKAIYACSLIEGRRVCFWQGTNLKCSEAYMDGASCSADSGVL